MTEGAAGPVAIGAHIAGKYVVERILGRGGMGVVAAARHLELDEAVAIKFLRPEALGDDVSVQRFVREGRAAAKIKSEHVARVFDVGRLEPSGAPYLVMELLDGLDLGELVKQKGPLPVDVAVAYVLQASEALAAAHAAGIVHRDLKPSNLFLTHRLDGSPLVKVIDFGISKIVGREGEGDMTASAMMMGSPHYMAPEQMKSARDVDARADVWALGGILHALLTGRAPFPASTVMGVYDLILKGPPALGRVDVPTPLEAAVQRCLALEPSKRFASVAELAAALAPFGGADGQASAARIAKLTG
ncbi:MAG TPA: serine/threonine-protein kinase, partial [Minicystis sp.]|nr:serine/threonine-protein kinase [Minicystis sp.]